MPDSTRRSTVTTYFLIVLVLYGSMSATGQAQSPGSLPAAVREADAWTPLLDLTRGSRVRLSLADGSEVEGQFVEAQLDAVVLERNVIRHGRLVKAVGSTLADPLTFDRSEITRFSIVHVATTYKAVGAVDAAAVRRLVSAFGKGQKVRLRTSDGQKIEGRMFATGGDALIVERGRQSPISIRYGDIKELNPVRMPVWQIALIGIGVVYAGMGLMVLSVFMAGI